MGIDALDLAFRLEKRFGIKIDLTREGSWLFDTPARVQQLVLAKLQGRPLASPKFEELYRFVQRLKSETRAAAGRLILRENDLNSMFRPATRQTDWDELGQRLGIRLPDLETDPETGEHRIPRECDTVFTLAWWILDHYPDKVAWIEPESTPGPPRAVSEAEVWRGVQECIGDALGYSPEDITPEKRMVADLGMD